MEEFVPGIVKTNNAKFNAGLEILEGKREAWGQCVDRVTDYFNIVRNECISQGLFKNIYIIDSRNYDETKYQLPTIGIYFGSHPLGYYAFDSKKIAIESGCTLSISQSILGNVFVTYYPFQSELLSRNEKYLIAENFHAPWAITDLTLDRLTNNFFSYAQVSSAFGKPSILDHYRIIRLRICHWWIHFNFTNKLIELLLLGVKTTVKIAQKSIST